MSNKKKAALMLLISLTFLPIFAQQYDYRLGFTGFFENREYDNLYAYDQTMFGSRLRAEAGVSPDSCNRIAAGFDYLYEFGGKNSLIVPDIVIYYQGTRKGFSYAIGSMPRYGRINMPAALLTDTLNYYRPNIEGIFLSYSSSPIKHNLWVDWTGRRSADTRESFTIGTSGQLSKGLFVYTHHAAINHLAHTEPKTEGQSLRDNIGFSAMAGLNLTPVTGLDTLSLTAGVMGSLDRVRGEYDFQKGLGIAGELNAGYKGFGIRSAIYSGDELMITSGDRSFNAGFISRTDLYYAVKQKFIETRVQFTYQLLPEADELALMFVVRVNIEGVFKHSVIK